MKNKILCAALTAALILSISGCGSSVGTSSEKGTEPASSISPATGDPPTTTTAGTRKAEYADEGIAAGDAAKYDSILADYDEPSRAKSDDFDKSYDAEAYSYDESYEEAVSAESDSYESATISLRDGLSIEYNQRRAGLLTGGEWRDNTNFTYWRKLFEQRWDWQNEIETWSITTLGRVFVRVNDSNGSPAAGMTVKLAEGNTLIWEAVTDSRGEAFLFAGIDPASKRTPDKIIVETSDGRAVTANVPDNYASTDTAVEITVPVSSPMRKKLDLMLMMDTTGSMADELSYLQTELQNVINRVADTTNADIMLSVNFYRDNGDDYVVRDFGFTKNISIALDHLSDQRANGGGDYPEAVTDALDNGINKHDWRSDSEKLMLLVLDAPPHYQDGTAYLKPLVINAAKNGIRIIPVASSGVDTDTEFLCRTLAIATGGTYTFLTDDSGIGNSHLEPTIGSYEVEKLNDMLVRIINDYFSQEPRQYNAQKPSSDNDQVSEGVMRYPASYSYTPEYYSGEGMYTTGVIRDKYELAEFNEKYGLDRYGNAPLTYTDFDRSAIAYKVELLSSGSITVDDSKGVYCTIENGEPVFRYSLNIPDYGTADIKSLFFFAEIPSSSLSDQ